MKKLFQDETFTVSRRDYLERMLQAALASALIPALRPANLFAGTSIGPTPGDIHLQGGFLERPNEYSSDGFVASAKYSNRRAFRFNLTKNKLVEIDSAVAIHSLEVHPNNSNLTVAVSRFSDTASAIDWSQNREIKNLRLTDQQEFYGHGAFTNDGRNFICSVARRKQGRLSDFSLLNINVETFKAVETVPFSFGANHDLLAVGDNRFAVSGGTEGDLSKGALTPLVIYDLATGKFHKIDSPVLPKFTRGSIAIRHLLKTTDKVVAAITRIENGQQQEGGLIEFDLQTRTSKFIAPMQAQPLHGELLSFEIAADGRIWVTLPEVQKLVVWNPKNQCVDATLAFDDYVRSIRTIRGLDYMVVGTDKEFYAYDPATLRRREAIDAAWARTSRSGRICSHTRLVQA